MAAQMNQLLIVEKHPELLTEGPIKLQANNLPEHHMETPIRNHSG